MGACCSAKRKNSVPIVTPQTKKTTKRIGDISDEEVDLICFGSFDVDDRRLPSLHVVDLFGALLILLIDIWAYTGIEDNYSPQLQLVFKQFDVNGDGYIEEPELKQVMTRLGQEPSNDEIRAMFKAADLNRDGKISYEEFTEIAQANPLSLSMKTVFGEMDKDGDGYVTRSEMDEALRRMGHQITENELNAIFKAADTDLDGKIDFEGNTSTYM
ncbi:unnamed protein product [Soboliphyme baturini]|uniref:Calmodulin n=1 Tax=Soboliphyme baturini TaxID=241478 RepID=A0A183J392_9BILA|nr:unnamed protein product [Soboliphyme baturini]